MKTGFLATKPGLGFWRPSSLREKEGWWPSLEKPFDSCFCFSLTPLFHPAFSMPVSSQTTPRQADVYKVLWLSVSLFALHTGSCPEKCLPCHRTGGACSEKPKQSCPDVVTALSLSKVTQETTASRNRREGHWTSKLQTGTHPHQTVSWSLFF